ncbi:MAG: TfoX/Sxy family DNA transformation protein, partial [Paracoccaceae bacterium]
MPSPVSSIPNLGPATEAAFARAGLTSAEQIRDLGADAAYLRWLAAGLPAHFIGYYALVMGLQGRPWNDCHGEEKKTLRLRFDALKLQAAKSGPVATWSKSKGRSDIEAALDALGV